MTDERKIGLLYGIAKGRMPGMTEEEEAELKIYGIASGDGGSGSAVEYYVNAVDKGYHPGKYYEYCRLPWHGGQKVWRRELAILPESFDKYGIHYMEYYGRPGRYSKEIKKEEDEVYRILDIERDEIIDEVRGKDLCGFMHKLGNVVRNQVITKVQIGPCWLRDYDGTSIEAYHIQRRIRIRFVEEVVDRHHNVKVAVTCEDELLNSASLYGVAFDNGLLIPIRLVRRGPASMHLRIFDRDYRIKHERADYQEDSEYELLIHIYECDERMVSGQICYTSNRVDMKKDKLLCGDLCTFQMTGESTVIDGEESAAVYDSLYWNKSLILQQM